MGDRKAKRKEHEIDGPSHGSNRSTAARVSGAYGGSDVGGGSAGASVALPIQNNPGHGQNAPRSAPAADQSLGRTTGLQPGVGLGGSAPRHGLQLQDKAQGSGNGTLTPTRRRGTHEKQRKVIPKTKTYVCPGCRVNTCSSNCVLCKPCATARAAVPAKGQQQLVDMADLTAAICPVGRRSGAAVPATSSPPHPSRTQQHQQLDASAQQQEQLRRFAELAADIWPVEQRGPPGGSPAIENSRPGLLGLPQENTGPRAGESLSTRRRGTLEKQPKPIPKTKTYVCPACHVNTCSSNGVACQPCATAWAAIWETLSPPQSHDQSTLRPQQHQQQQSPPPVGVVAQQQQEQPRRFAELAADIWPVEERGGASGGRPAVQLEHLQRQPQEHPALRADKPVEFHYNPVVIGPGPDPEDGWCPACRFYPARTVLQPWQHDCVCYTCLKVDRIVCPVCGSA